MILLGSLLVLAVLVWLSLPPREGERWALLLGFGLAMAWLLLTGLQRGIATELGPRGPLWLMVLAAVGAPLIQLLVWSVVTFATRPRAHRAAPSDEHETAENAER
ncbi:MAG: hypothetical protein M5U01_36200 [Ardenticatenaceae bacterium]|nr:hypothetical protein [Ardenticatenaceae bacterium]HBY94245.1 hypothetical protein [Chloroflexota bacterium]